MLQELRQCPNFRMILGSLCDMTRRVLLSLNIVKKASKNKCFYYLYDFSKNSENEVNNKISEKKKRSVQKRYMSIFLTRKICISNPLYEFLKKVG